MSHNSRTSSRSPSWYICKDCFRAYDSAQKFKDHLLEYHDFDPYENEKEEATDKDDDLEEDTSSKNSITPVKIAKDKRSNNNVNVNRYGTGKRKRSSRNTCRSNLSSRTQAKESANSISRQSDIADFDLTQAQTTKPQKHRDTNGALDKTHTSSTSTDFAPSRSPSSPSSIKPEQQSVKTRKTIQDDSFSVDKVYMCSLCKRCFLEKNLYKKHKKIHKKL